MKCKTIVEIVTNGEDIYEAGERAGELFDHTKLRPEKEYIVHIETKEITS